LLNQTHETDFYDFSKINFSSAKQGCFGALKKENPIRETTSGWGTYGLKGKGWDRSLWVTF